MFFFSFCYELQISVVYLVIDLICKSHTFGQLQIPLQVFLTS